eukprot:TRINITY_DN13601_c0_g1_i13.p1 TRINITY_DN13601_c0_g1~~TRINITY_DN13601_c0_g1_i13.p1  ORF type:complete len:251 (+),score=65.91 TRINITY_DN13601_c0_g1_i13:382-1134(+)
MKVNCLANCIGWVEYLSKNSDIEILCNKVTDLSFMCTQIDHLTAIYTPNASANIKLTVSASLSRLAEYLAYTLTFIRLGTVTYSSLYVKAAKSMTTLASGLYFQLDLFKVLRKKLDLGNLEVVLSEVLHSLMNAWLHYMMMLLVDSKGEEMSDLPAVIADDKNQLKEFFCASAGNNPSYAERVKELLKPMDKFLYYLKADDNTLIGEYKKIGTQNEVGKELITRILYLSLIHICRCRRYAVCRSRWSPYH